MRDRLALGDNSNSVYRVDILFLHFPRKPIGEQAPADEISPPHLRGRNYLTVTDFGGIYRRPHVHSEIRWPQVLFQQQVIAKSLFLDLLTRKAGKASHMTVNLSKEPLFEGQTGSPGCQLAPQ